MDSPQEESLSVVSPRGTEDGLILRIDGKADWNEIVRDVDAYLGKRKKFFAGGQVFLEWLDKLPSIEQLGVFEKHLLDEFGLSVGAKRRGEELALAPEPVADESNPPKEQRGIHSQIQTTREPVTVKNFLEKIPQKFLSSLQSEKRALVSGYRGNTANDRALNDKRGSNRNGSAMFAEEVFVDEDANAKIVFGPLRSGQRIETPFSLVVIGDVNPGCDLIAGGDIFVFGSLRGTAHASAYDDEGFDRIIVAQQMQPVQLRIGAVISRGGGDAGRGPEVARIDSRRIVVESYSGKSVQTKR